MDIKKDALDLHYGNFRFQIFFFALPKLGNENHDNWIFLH